MRRVARVKRLGFSFLELQVAGVLLAVGLAGLAPLVVMQLKQTARVEARVPDEQPLYVVRSPEDWTRKLGASGRLSSTPPTLSAPSGGSAVNTVLLLSLERSLVGSEATAHVSVLPK